MPEVLLLDVEFYADERRDFLEPYNLKSWQALGLRKHFVQDYQSRSKTGSCGISIASFHNHKGTVSWEDVHFRRSGLIPFRIDGRWIRSYPDAPRIKEIRFHSGPDN